MTDGRSARESKAIAVDEWSKPVARYDRFLRAHWLLELENGNGDFGAAQWVYFDAAKRLQLEVVDASGKLVPPSPTGGSGGDVGPGWIIISCDFHGPIKD